MSSREGAEGRRDRVELTFFPASVESLSELCPSTDRPAVPAFDLVMGTAITLLLRGWKTGGKRKRARRNRSAPPFLSFPTRLQLSLKSKKCQISLPPLPPRTSTSLLNSFEISSPTVLLLRSPTSAARTRASSSSLLRSSTPTSYWTTSKQFSSS